MIYGEECSGIISFGVPVGLVLLLEIQAGIGIIHAITNINENNHNILCVDLGGGQFRLIKYLIKIRPNWQYLNIDLSKYAQNSYKEQLSSFENVALVPCDVMNFEKWIPQLKASYKDLVIISYGFLMYLTPGEIITLFIRINSLDNFSHMVCIEPYNKHNIENETVKKEGESFSGDGSFYHNYRYYLEKANFKIHDYDSLFNESYV